MSSIPLVCLATLFHLGGQEWDELSEVKKGYVICIMTPRKATATVDFWPGVGL